MEEEKRTESTVEVVEFVEEGKIELHEYSRAERMKRRSGGKGGEHAVRNLQERERDLVRVSELWLEGRTHAQIAEVLEAEGGERLSLPMIGKMTRIILERWQRSYLANVQAAMLVQLAKIDKVEGEYWDAWERSKRVLESEVVEEDIDREGAETKSGYRKGTAKDSDLYVKERRRMVVKTAGYGDDRYLKGIERCIAQRCKILGIGENRVTVNWKIEARNAGFDPDRMFEDMKQRIIDVAASDR